MEKSYKLYHGDCLDELKNLQNDSIDSIVTDPPYGLSFMGKKWDYDVPSQEIWEECLRVLKPGGHLLSFAGSRTYHRMAVRIEDAGFDIRDQIMWVYGSGFPKSHNIGKAVDRLQGNDREVVGVSKNDRPNSQVKGGRGFDSAFNNGQEHQTIMETKGNSPYEGWGTALKPSHEPIVMARKPFKGSVAENVLEWGTGGINVDGCRIGYKNEADEKSSIPGSLNSNQKNSLFGMGEGHQHNTEGRFPANIIFDEEAGKILDEQSGITSQGHWPKGKTKGFGEFGGGESSYEGVGPKDTEKGGASRFFYCPKAGKKDRNEGVELEPKSIKGRDEGQDKTSIAYKARPTERQNIHPTVKPTDLMTYLVRLVTPKGGVVLDPFMGSGSTGKAAIREGFQFVGIEREEEYLQIAEQRIEWEYKQQHPHNWF